MIVSSYVNLNRFFSHHDGIFRFLLCTQIDCFKRFLNKQYFINLFPLKYKKELIIVNYVDMKFINSNYYYGLYNYNSELIYVFIILDFDYSKFYGYRFLLRKKILLFSFPKLNYNYSFIIGDIEKNVVFLLKNFSRLHYFNDNLNEISVYSNDNQVIKFSFKLNCLYVSINNSKNINFYNFSSFFGLSIKYFLNKFLKKISLLISNQLILIKFKDIIITNGFSDFNIYSYDGKLLISKYKYISSDFIFKYGDLLCRLDSSYYNNLILAKSIKYGEIYIRKYSRLNLMKLFYLIKTNLLINVYLLDVNYRYISKILLKNNIKIDINIYKNIFNIFKLRISKSSIKSLINSNILNKSKLNTNNKLINVDYKSLYDLYFKSGLYFKISKLSLLEINNYYNKKSNVLLKKDIFNIIHLLINNVKINFDNRYLIGFNYYIYNIIRNNINMFIYNIVIKSYNALNNYYFNIISNYIREFLSISQYSQYLEHNNFISELTHKRRLMFYTSDKTSNVGLNLRSINTSYFGRICPLETPEGLNIGLVTSLSIFSKIKFISNFMIAKIFTPCVYLKKNNYYLFYLDLINENKRSISDYFMFNNYTYVKKNNLFYLKKINNISYFYLSSIQLFSLTPLFIPFLNHNDGNRILMGSNMQRQALPCIGSQLPYVLTGVENIPSLNLNYCKLISFNYKYTLHSKFIIYYYIIKNIFILKNFILKKFVSTNQYSCINQKFVLNYNVYDKLLINDNINTINGYLCLGCNILVAFLPWRGYNFEDSIIISNRLSNSNYFTSIHIYKFETSISITNFGNEILIKRDCDLRINDVRNINKNGIINLGSNVIEGDILVCKYIPIKKTRIISYYDLYNKIFTKTSFMYKQLFLKLPLGINGIVTNVNIINNFNLDKSSYFSYYNYIRNILIKKFIKKNNLHNLFGYIKLRYYKFRLILINISFIIFIRLLLLNNRLYKLFVLYLNKHSNMNLGFSILKKIIVTVTCKRYLQIGDKMSGRYGNKGIVSKILPIEEMPYLYDGSICDMILNPISIPSRMNIGQLFELKLGLIMFLLFKEIKLLISSYLYKEISSLLFEFKFKYNYKNYNLLINNYHNILNFKSISFDGMNLEYINSLSNIVKRFKSINYKYILNNNEKLILWDGLSGLKLGYISIGFLYFLKLYHIIDNKIHVRSVGPYSSITYQPLKGRSNLGGQRIGEMEIWALEAYGASYIINEMLVLKSSVLYGNYNLIKNIFNDKLIINLDISETLRILLVEIKSLCLDIYLS